MSHANNQILYFSDKATVLARSYEDQIRDLLMLGDYLTEDIANDLHIPVNADIWNIKRVRLANDIPIAYEDEYFAKPIVPKEQEDK